MVVGNEKKAHCDVQKLNAIQIALCKSYIEETALPICNCNHHETMNQVKVSLTSGNVV